MNDEAAKKITRARTALVLDEPFFGTLALRLQVRENDQILTFRTNGIVLEYSPKYVNEISADICKSAICHEVLHVANGHAWRRDARDAKRFNVAADYAINPILSDAGFKIGKGWLLDNQFAGMSAEQIYNALPDSKDDDDGEDGEQGSDPGPGEVTDAPSGEATTLEAEWQVATIQAATAAQAQGKLLGSLKGFVQKLKETKVDWRAATLKFAQERCKDDYTWRLPNRRYVAHGLYLPTLYNERMGDVVLVVDTSGSCSSVIPVFGAHMQTVLDTVRPRMLHVVYADNGIQAVDTFEPGDDIKMRRDGGGGTSFRPPFAWVAEQGIEPACLIYLTDLYGDFPDDAPEYPVLWASVTKQVAPFGETIYIDEGER